MSGDDIRKKVGCGRIHDSFRSGDGPRLWNRLVVPVTGTKGMYRLNLPDPK